MTRKHEDEDIRRRTYAAWHSKAESTDKPLPNGCELVVLEGRRYAVLHSGIQVIAVYRVRPSGQLKYLTRPPKLFKEAM